MERNKTIMGLTWWFVFLFMLFLVVSFCIWLLLGCLFFVFLVIYGVMAQGRLITGYELAS